MIATEEGEAGVAVAVAVAVAGGLALVVEVGGVGSPPTVTSTTQTAPRYQRGAG